MKSIQEGEFNKGGKQCLEQVEKLGCLQKTR